MCRPSAVSAFVGAAVLTLIGSSAVAQDLRDVAQSPNQFATADALERFYAGATECDCDLSQSIRFLHAAPGDVARRGLDELSGQDLAGMFGPRQTLTGLLTQRLAWQLRPAGPEPPRRLIEYVDAPAGGTGPVGGPCGACDSACGAKRAYLAGPRPVTWMQGFGGVADGAGSPGVYDSHLGGVLFGGHLPVGDAVALGLAGEFGHAGAGAARTDLNVNTWRLLGYGRYSGETAYAFGGAGYGFDNYSTERQVVIGSFDRVARGDADGHEAFGFGEAGLTLPLSGTLALQPFAGLSASHLVREGFTEQGAGQLGLIAAGADTSSLATYVGGRAVVQRYLAPDLLLRPEVRAAWWHDYLADGGTLNAAWVRDPGTLFAVGAAAPGRDAAVLGAGATLVTWGQCSFGAQYDAALGSHAVAHLFALTALCTW